MAALYKSRSARCAMQWLFYSTVGKTAAVSSQQSKLAKLRKKTGFAIRNCKTALENSDNDFNKALQWLAEQAQKEGWAKATKLQGRETTNGLIGLIIDPTMATAVELSCETDFVARNEKFQSLVMNVAETCRTNLKKKSMLECVKVDVTEEELKSMPMKEHNEKSLADYVAFNIGQIGENIVLRRCQALHVPEDAQLAYYVHGASTTVTSHCHLGRYAAVVALKAGQPVGEVGRRLCQHIVGMKPVSVGEWTDWTTWRDRQGQEDTESDEINNNKDSEESKDTKDSQQMLFQSYLIDEDLTVGDVLDEHDIRVVDFIRMECGERTQTD